MSELIAPRPPDPTGSRLRAIFDAAPYQSIKHASYFQVYEEVLHRFVDQPFVFVEVGVLNGGSLFMWREYFGPKARIIGVDMNPGAERWREHGFEIFIGDQSDPAFWDTFFAQVGTVDVLLDDGGHLNQQQIVTADKAIFQIRDGGVLLVEDVHASFLPEFHNPSAHSFMNFAKRIADSMYARFPSIRGVGAEYWKKVYSVCFYESIVVFNIDSRRCFPNSWASNNGATNDAADFRYASHILTALF